MWARTARLGFPKSGPAAGGGGRGARLVLTRRRQMFTTLNSGNLHLLFGRTPAETFGSLPEACRYFRQPAEKFGNFRQAAGCICCIYRKSGTAKTRESSYVSDFRQMQQMQLAACRHFSAGCRKYRQASGRLPNVSAGFRQATESFGRCSTEK